jgi:hypothetical protein
MANNIDESKEFFKKWFGQTVDLLSNKEYAGIPLLMIAFPLFERYANGHFSSNIPLAFERSFSITVLESKIIWQCFRVGLLHKASFKTEFELDGKKIFIHECGVSESLHAPIHITKEQNNQWRIFISPSRFSKLVIDKILENYEEFYSACEKQFPFSKEIPPSRGDILDYCPPSTGLSGNSAQNDYKDIGYSGHQDTHSK